MKGSTQFQVMKYFEVEKHGQRLVHPGIHALASVLTHNTKYTCDMTHMKYDSATPTKHEPGLQLRSLCTGNFDTVIAVYHIQAVAV